MGGARAFPWRHPGSPPRVLAEEATMRRAMRRAGVLVGSATVAVILVPASASATIHPIVGSAECASATADAAHPLGDVADPPGQTPGEGSHSETSTLSAVMHANASAFSAHKVDEQCGPGAE